MSAGQSRRFIHLRTRVMQTEQDDDLIRYELRLDRSLLKDLQHIAEQQRCGIGGVIRFYVKNAIASAKARSRRNSHH
jgi:hypothetical protein